MGKLIEIVKGLSIYILIVIVVSLVISVLASMGGIFEIIACLIVLYLFWLKIR